MNLSSDDAFETLNTDALRRLVVGLLQRLRALETQVAELEDQSEQAETARATLQAENQDVRDEIARLKNLPPRPLWSVDLRSRPRLSATGAKAG